MNPDQPELTLDESVKQVMQTLPPVIRTYLAQGKYTVVAKTLMAKYGLRVDQAGVLEREIMLLLMGIENPDEFIQALVEEAKLDKKIVDGSVQDVNTQIFIPLRQEEMKSEQMKKETPVSAPASSPVSIPPVSVPPTSTSSAAGNESHFHLENKIPLPPTSASVPMSPSATPFPRAAGSAQRPAMIAPARPINSNTLLEDHEEPHIEFSKTIPSSSPAPIRTMPPAAPFPMRSGALKSMPPANLPGAMPSAIIPPGGRPSFTTPQKIEPSVNASIASIVPPPAPSKPYATDPYREPIE